jgi:aminopeptidase N
VGDFGYLETKTAAGVPVRVYAPTGMEKDGQFSLDLAAKTLDFFGKEFGSPYPLPKMDMVAIPDFSAGAMEVVSPQTQLTVELGISYISHRRFIIRC